MPDQRDRQSNDGEEDPSEAVDGPLCKVTRVPNVTGAEAEDVPTDGAFVRETAHFEESRATISRYTDVESVARIDSHTVVVKLHNGAVGVHDHVDAFGAGHGVTVQVEKNSHNNTTVEDL